MTKTAPCGYNDADLVRARKYITIDEIGCHLWTGTGSGLKQRVVLKACLRGQELYQATIPTEPQFSLHCRKILPKQLFYAAANGLSIDDVPHLTNNCPGDNHRLCCNPDHQRPKLVDGNLISRNPRPRIPTAQITPELMSKFDLTLTQAEINFKLATPDSYAEEAAILARIFAMEGDTIELLTDLAEKGGMTVRLTQANVDRYIKEHPHNEE